ILGIWIIVRHPDRIGAVDQILQRGLSAVGLVVDASTPESGQVPVGSVDTRDIGANQEPGIRPQPPAVVVTCDARVIEANSSAGAIDLRQGRPRNHYTRLIIERVALAERDYDRIFSGRAQGTLPNQSLRVLRRKVRPIAHFYWARWIVNLAYCRRQCSRSYFQFSDRL